MDSQVYKPSYKKTLAMAYGVCVPTLSKWIRIAQQSGANIQIQPRSLIQPSQVKAIVEHLGEPERPEFIRQQT